MYEEGRGGGSAVIGRLLVAAVIIIISLISYFGHREYNPVTHKNQHVGGMTARAGNSSRFGSDQQMAKQYGGVDGDPRHHELVDEVGERSSKTAT